MTSVMTVLFHPGGSRGEYCKMDSISVCTSYCMTSPAFTPKIKASAKSHPPLAVLYLTSSTMYRHVL
jgi:hypothetical protein